MYFIVSPCGLLARRPAGTSTTRAPFQAPQNAGQYAGADFPRAHKAKSDYERTAFMSAPSLLYQLVTGTQHNAQEALRSERSEKE